MLSRIFSTATSSKITNALRTHPDNLYLEYIKDLRNLPAFDKELIYLRTYSIFSACFSKLTYDEYISYCSNIPVVIQKILMLKDKTYNIDVGYIMISCDELFLKEGDKSKENTYFSTQCIFTVLPHYRGISNGLRLQDACEAIIRSEYPNRNRVSINTTLNPVFYDYRQNLTPLVFPSQKKNLNQEPENLIKTFMKKQNLEPINEEKPFVVSLPLTIVGADAAKYKANYKNSSEGVQFFIDQTGLEKDMILINMAIYNLIEGNTLGLPGKSYEKVNENPFELRDYVIVS